MIATSLLLDEGRSSVPRTRLVTEFCRRNSCRSEAEFKTKAKTSGEVMYHAHIGLSDWGETAAALRSIEADLARDGSRLHRYGLALDRGMGLPASLRATHPKETGPRLTADDWTELGTVAAIQPHLGDHMIGMPASLENVLRAMTAGVTTIGNLGQFFGFDVPGYGDDISTTEETLRSLGAMAAAAGDGFLVHSYLDDGPATQFSNYGAFVGWAALELHIIETMIGARLAHSFGGLVERPEARAVVALALDDIRGGESVGSMIYGNTVGHQRGNRARNLSVLVEHLTIDIATQLRRPTGHAVNPIPLTEAERIPTADEIVEVQRVAREVERVVRRSPELFDWPRLENVARRAADHAVSFRDRVLDLLGGDGVNTDDAGELLLALRRIDPAELERRIALDPPDELVTLQPWKARRVTELTDAIDVSGHRLDGLRVVVAVLEAHDVVRDALARGLPRRGCEVVVLPSNTTVAGVARATVDEDADALVIGTYNGNALQLGAELMSALGGYPGAVYFGGVLNQDVGASVPRDVAMDLTRLGITCVHDVAHLPMMLATLPNGIERA